MKDYNITEDNVIFITSTDSDGFKQFVKEVEETEIVGFDFEA